jgi:hypothetical protein
VGGGPRRGGEGGGGGGGSLGVAPKARIGCGMGSLPPWLSYPLANRVQRYSCPPRSMSTTSPRYTLFQQLHTILKFNITFINKEKENENHYLKQLHSTKLRAPSLSLPWLFGAGYTGHSSYALSQLPYGCITQAIRGIWPFYSNPTPESHVLTLTIPLNTYLLQHTTISLFTK